MWETLAYRLFVWLCLSSLALSGFLNVISRQPVHGGGVLVVRPQLTELLLAVQPQPQVPVQSAVVAAVKPGEMPAKEEAGLNRATQAKIVHTKKASIPGVLVIRSGVSTKLFAGIFVPFKQWLLSGSSVTAAPRALLYKVAFFLELRGGECVIFGKIKLGLHRGGLLARHLLETQAQFHCCAKSTPFYDFKHAVLSQLHTCIFIIAAETPCSAADWKLSTAAPMAGIPAFRNIKNHFKCASDKQPVNSIFEKQQLTRSSAKGVALHLNDCLAKLSQASHQQHHIACHGGLKGGGQWGLMQLRAHLQYIASMKLTFKWHVLHII